MVNTETLSVCDWQTTRRMVDALIDSEPDLIANMANVSALLWQQLPDINWVGFYRVMDNELVLGPFQGKPACIRIPFGKGVCGTAAQQRLRQNVADVHQFDGHIACDAASNSEVVVPIFKDGKVFAVLDIDSPSIARFDADDQAGLEALVKCFEANLK